MTLQWLLKVKRYDGSESVLSRYENRDVAQKLADKLNADIQSNIYYVEKFDKELWGHGFSV